MNKTTCIFEAQIVRLTRVYRGEVSLLTFLKDFEKEPRLCAPLTSLGLPDDLRQPLNPEADRAALGRQLAPLGDWRDKRIAHIDRQWDLLDVRPGDLSPMVDAVASAFGRYAWRITGTDYQLMSRAALSLEAHLFSAALPLPMTSMP